MRNCHNVTASVVISDCLVDLADPAQRLCALYVVPVDPVRDVGSFLKAPLANQGIDLIQTDLEFILIHCSILVLPDVRNIFSRIVFPM